MASVASNLRGGRHSHLAITMTLEEYLDQTVHTFIQPHNPGNYPPTMGTSQQQALGTERFQKNQSLFQHCTAVYGAIKNKIFTAVQPLFLSPLWDQLMQIGKFTVLHMLQHMFSSNGEIDEINPEEM